MDGKFTRPCVHECAAQLPHRYRWHDQDLVGGRLRRYRSSGGLDGNLLRRGGFTNSHSYGYCNSDRNSDGNGDCNRNCNDHGYSELHSHAEACADRETSPDSGASTLEVLN